MMEENLGDWQLVLKEEFVSSYFQHLKEYLIQERCAHTIFPPENEVLDFLRKTPFSKTRVVLIGQDPYHGLGQAHGLSFSVPRGVKIPPSLKNIFKEILRFDPKIEFKSGCLDSWAHQGVLLLNTVLTVRQAEAFSHKKIGWEQFTDAIIKKLMAKNDKIIFILLGNKAQEKVESKIELNSHHVFLKAAHPSPLSARFFHGSKIFAEVNQNLSLMNSQPIDWSTF